MTASEQARADAMADAETLRINARLGATLTHGNSVINSAKRTDWQAPTLAYCRAVEAARAAFRAVPGLRG